MKIERNKKRAESNPALSRDRLNELMDLFESEIRDHAQYQQSPSGLAFEPEPTTIKIDQPLTVPDNPFKIDGAVPGYIGRALPCPRCMKSTMTIQSVRPITTNMVESIVSTEREYTTTAAVSRTCSGCGDHLHAIETWTYLDRTRYTL